MTPKHVTLMTRTGCHLCDEAHEAIAQLATEVAFTWSEVDVDTSADLQDQYGDRVPVVLINGREHGYWRVETQRLRAALSG